ncbi:MAG: lysophospholipase, partial [Burkholderiales bacterium]
MSADSKAGVSTEARFASHDGVELFYRHWAAAAEGRGPRRAIILLHRGHEHGARMQDVVDKLGLPDIDCFAWDARGHGLSPGERGYAADFGVLVRDVDRFVRHISTRYEVAMSNIVVIGSSVGAVLAATWVHDYAPRIRALVLGSPAFRVKLYIPFAVPLLRVLLKLKGKAFVTSYVKAKLLTHDPAKIVSYENDPLVTRQIAVNILLGLHDAGTKLMDDAGAITVPTQVLVSEADWVVQPGAQRRFY